MTDSQTNKQKQPNQGKKNPPKEKPDGSRVGSVSPKKGGTYRNDKDN